MTCSEFKITVYKNRHSLGFDSSGEKYQLFCLLSEFYETYNQNTELAVVKFRNTFSEFKTFNTQSLRVQCLCCKIPNFVLSI